jgi:hypothetical protein
MKQQVEELRVAFDQIKKSLPEGIAKLKVS